MVASVLCSLERGDRVDDFVCGHDGTGVVWEVDVERGVHLFRVSAIESFYHRDFVAKLSGKADTFRRAEFVCAGALDPRAGKPDDTP